MNRKESIFFIVGIAITALLLAFGLGKGDITSLAQISIQPTWTHTPSPSGPTATFTPVPPTATFTPVPPTATFTPVPPIPSNSPPVVTVDHPVVTVDEGSLALNSGSAVDPDGSLGGLGASVGGLTFDGSAWGWQHVPLDGPDDSQPVTIWAIDDSSEYGYATFALQVINVAPDVGSILGPLAPVPVGTLIDFTTIFTDPGVLDTHDAVLAWGDGSVCSTATALNCTLSEGIPTGSVEGSHTYSAPGVYSVGLAVADDDGGVGTSIFEYVIVYDPSAGFVTGGGWIDSPPGAYVPDPSLTGRATFGFVSRYKKGAGAPDGNTEFQFRAADMNFHSGSYDWLVVAEHKAMFRGVGTINGAGKYGFLLSAIDADLTPSTDVDLFRIKIWDLDDGDVVVYDNQIACSDLRDNAEPCTAVGGGSVVVHKGN